MLIVIQARMNSSRLPGKVLKDVCGKPLIGQMLDRLSFSKHKDQIVVATSTDSNDDELVKYVQSLGVKVFRGNQDDVLERYFFAAQAYKANHVMRLTADCPLMDPYLCDALVQIYLDKKVDYLNTGLSYAEGMSIEIFSFEALKKSYHEARLRSEREHVTLYIKNHPELFKLYTKENQTDDSKYRLTVDEPEDLELIRLIFKELSPKTGGIVSIGQVKAFIDQNPSVGNLNKHIVRKEGLIKSLKEDYVVDPLSKKKPL
jgi:spore coat polysaccharide biosynthesis protein SpsF